MGATSLNSVIDRLRKAALLPDCAGMSDGQLLERYVNGGEAAAFEVLMQRHGAMVLGVCRRILRNVHDAEDAFQATFLVLVRKAASIWPREMVANWLYGVAYRTALKARAMTARRQVKEKPLSATAEVEAVTQDDVWHDLRSVLDQALSRLPQKYRIPVVLCDLEGKSGKEAARQLGWPEGTVSSRLSRARALLAKRLARHSLAVSAGSLAGLLAEKAASASVPGSLLLSTANAARLYATGQSMTGGAISTKVASLTKGMLSTMFLNRLVKIGAVVFTTVALATGFGVMLGRLPAKGLDDEKKEVNKAPQTPKDGVSRLIAGQIQAAYWSNEASADENFTGKRIQVTGNFSRIKREIHQGPTYFLIMSPRLRMSLQKAVDFPPVFRFGMDARKQLAGLKPGYEVTIEGRCVGRRESANGEESILFYDCKIIEISPRPEAPLPPPFTGNPAK